ncbi:MAG: hypothetical protein R2758_06635 [Bacteroidales bacterium]
MEIKLSHQVVNDWFDLKAVVIIGQFTIPFTRFRRNILEGIREYTLPDGTVALLPEEWFARYRGLFEMGREKDDNLLCISNISAYSVRQYQMNTVIPVKDWVSSSCLRSWPFFRPRWD